MKEKKEADWKQNKTKTYTAPDANPVKPHDRYYNHHCTIHEGTLGRVLNYILNPMNVIYRNNGIVFPLPF